MATIAPLGKYRALDANGAPLAGGKLYTYEAGTSTPKATYTSNTLSTANTNPVILDADGYANVWLDVGGYKFVLDDANDVNQFTVDGIDGGSAVGFASSVVSRSSSFGLGVNEQNVVSICTAPLTVSLLPAATAGNGFSSVIVNLSGGNVTVDPDGSETINNVGSLVIGNGNSLTLSTDGLEWYAFGYTQTEFSDSIFRIVDNADASKKLAFETSGITTGTTATLSVTNNSLGLPATGSLESQLVLQERLTSGGNTATIVPTNPMAASRTYTLPDASGNFVLDSTLATTSVAGAVELATSAETQAGTDTARAVTPAAFSASSLGYGQTWQDLTASRALATNYTNSTGRPIQVLARVTCVSGAQNITATVGGVAVVVAMTAPTANAGAVGSFIVPNGAVYQVSSTGTPTLQSWAELR